MANKPGACDLRCNEAVLSAMLAHPAHGKRKEFREWGAEMVARGNWAFARYLPAATARRALIAVEPALTKKQRPTGLWFKTHGEELSLPILTALKHAGLLDKWLEEGRLRHDPLRPFQSQQNLFGVLVRMNIAGKPQEGDELLRRQLVDGVLNEQREDGSIGRTVAMTSFQIERLLALGVSTNDKRVNRAAEWMLGQYRESLAAERHSGAPPVFASKVFTTLDLGAEWRAAGSMMQHMFIASACFMVLPNIQTALALRALAGLGFAKDARVSAAYDTLLSLRVMPNERHDSAGARYCHGDWCAHKLRFKLEDQAHAGSALPRCGRAAGKR